MNKSAEHVPGQNQASQDASRRTIQPRQSFDPQSGQLTQLSALINNSPRIHSLQDMGSWMNSAASFSTPPAQFETASAPSPAVLSNDPMRVNDELKEGIQQSSALQGLTALAAEINHGVPAQLQEIPANNDVSPGEADMISPDPLTRQEDSPVQRVRILLKDEDQDLMERVRAVPVTNAGGQTIQNPDQIGTLTQIGVNETIVLEGHGYFNDPLWGEREVVSQGGISPANLAKIVRDVPKPAHWTGNVVLLGCATGHITQAVSQEYFKLTQTPVKVIGTRASIRVGTREDGTVFAGHDWSEQPVNERPADLAYVNDLQRSLEVFSAALKQLMAISKVFAANAKGTPTPMPYSLDPVGTRGNYIVAVDGASTHKATARHGRRYARPERVELGFLFSEVIVQMQLLSFFKYPDTIKPVTDTVAARRQVDKVLLALTELVQADTRLRHGIAHELLGYTLKEIDLDSNVSAKHSKRRRTATSIFGDTWVDEP